jgi:hypothetical protein
VRNIEMREESGTPDIIGSVRIGLCLMIREKISDDLILKKEHEINSYIYKELSNVPNLLILGPKENYKKIPILSFAIKFSGKLFHYNFICSLLNDLFGIQSRGGCACASTYGQKCLGLNENKLSDLEKIVCNGCEIFRPGYTRVNFPYFYEWDLIDYIIYAIKFVAKYGYLFLSHYAFKIESGEYYHRKEEEEKRRWLNQLDFKDGDIIIPSLTNEKEENLTKRDLENMKNKADEILRDMRNITKHTLGKSKINHLILFEENESNRWFLIPDDLEHLNIIDNFEEASCKESSEKNFNEKINKEAIIKLNVGFNLEKVEEDNKNVLLNSNTNTNLYKNENENEKDKDKDIDLINEFSEEFHSKGKKSNKKNIDTNLFPE